ncbi:MAG: hydantoinase/oxoprolinase family protein [Armatimonadetes bacterium]|nr:hydantoinase/oxoprolinase family protein [Armatimonadota bacterium]
MPNFRIGIDVGGTFTDVVAVSGDGRSWHAFKVPGHGQDPTAAVLDGLARVLARGGVEAIVHGTTLATNALLEGRTARTALVTTRGFRDVLEITRTNREHLYRLDRPLKPPPLVPRHLRFEVTERTAHDGAIIEPLRREDVSPLIQAIVREDVEAVAVCLLHAYANPAHEQALGEALRARFRHVSLSHEVNAEFREYERTSTVVVNAGLLPLVGRYVETLREGVAAHGVRALRLIRSNGGMAGVDAAARRPLSLLFSGPAAGVAAARTLVTGLGVRDAITLDMGGTSTDVCLIARGDVEVLRERRIEGHPVRVPSLAVESVGAGGGSIAWLDPAGALRVGPRSAGAAPGPACYGRGGTEPTVTDACVALGYLSPSRPLGGTIALDPSRSEAALRPVARRLTLSRERLAWGICEIACANMMRAVRTVSVQRGYDPRQFALVTFGGAGPMLAGRLAQHLRIGRILVPAFSSAFSAYGCLASDVRYDRLQTFRLRLNADLEPMEERLAALAEDVAREVQRDGFDPARAVLLRSLDLRYVGQNDEIEVRLSDGRLDAGEIRRRFQERHQALYAYTTGEAVECINLRVAVVVPAEVPPLPRLEREGAEPSGTRRAYFPDAGWTAAAIYERTALGGGVRIAGPAVIEDEWSTVVVSPGQSLESDGHGNLWIETGAGERA